MAKKQKTYTQEELEQMSLERQIKDAQKRSEFIGKAPNERKVFSVGEDVNCTHNGVIECKVIEILEEGIYKLRFRYITDKPYSNEKIECEKTMVYNWDGIYKKDTNISFEPLSIAPRIQFNFHQSDISSLINTYYGSFGINLNPDYQRELVWSLEDKVKLIDSIFNRVEIGKFCLIQLPYVGGVRNYGYEVLDGKQRINTLVSFMSDEFTYKGRYYSQLSYFEQRYVTSYSISMCIINQEITEEQKLEYFIRLNTGGVSMSQEHLDKIKNKLKNL